MIRVHLITSALCLSVCATAFAHQPEGGKIWGTVGPTFHRTRTAHPVAKRPPYVGAAVVVEADVDDNGGVEIGMVYLNKIYVLERDDAVLAERIKRMFITTGYRHWFAPWVSAAGAVFSSYSMGDPEVVLDHRASGAAFTTSARDITEYGLEASLQWEIWGDGDVAVVADARFASSLTENDGENADVYGVLLGYKHRWPNRRR